jgi:hypothetical protein
MNNLDNFGLALREVRRFDEAISGHQDAAAALRETTTTTANAARCRTSDQLRRLARLGRLDRNCLRGQR